MQVHILPEPSGESQIGPLVCRFTFRRKFNVDPKSGHYYSGSHSSHIANRVTTMQVHMSIKSQIGSLLCRFVFQLNLQSGYYYASSYLSRISNRVTSIQVHMPPEALGESQIRSLLCRFTFLRKLPVNRK